MSSPYKNFRKIVKSDRFELFIGVVNVFNAITGPQPTAWRWGRSHPPKPGDIGMLPAQGPLKLGRADRRGVGDSRGNAFAKGPGDGGGPLARDL